MRKQDIRTHSERYGKVRPAVNVKVYKTFRQSELEDHYNTTEAEAERLAQLVWDCQCEDFWRSWAEDDCWPEEVLGKGIKIYSEGRSGGWLVVEGLPDVETWNAVRVAKWAKFAKAVRADVDYRASLAAAVEMIDANDWLQVSDTIPTFHAIQ
jgi:hypothetical protein